MFFERDEEFRRFAHKGLNFNETLEISRYSTKPKHAFLDAIEHKMWITVEEDIKYQYIYVTRPLKLSVDEVVEQISHIPSRTNTYLKISSNPTGSRISLNQEFGKKGIWSVIDSSHSFIHVLFAPYYPKEYLQVITSTGKSMCEVFIPKKDDRAFIDSFRNNGISVKTRRITNNILGVQLIDKPELLEI